MASKSWTPFGIRKNGLLKAPVSGIAQQGFCRLAPESLPRSISREIGQIGCIAGSYKETDQYRSSNSEYPWHSYASYRSPGLVAIAVRSI